MDTLKDKQMLETLLESRAARRGGRPSAQQRRAETGACSCS